MSDVIKINEDRDYYCSMKFRYIKFDLERKTTYTCHAATPHDVDFNWLEKNPGQIFNSPTNINERHQMLGNERNASCEQNCWPAEDRGEVSPRLLQGGPKKTHTNVIVSPEIIDITIGSDCNLKCLYCCKEYSSTWRNDILKNGNYNLDSEPDRYKLATIDKVLSSVNQHNRINSKHYQILLDELILNSKEIKELVITGGEPFLNNSTVDVISKLSHVPLVTIYSGLGVNYNRFSKIINELSEYKNVNIIVSAEGIDKFLEFNRFGTEWNDFQKKIQLLNNLSIKYHFQCTITNLTVFGVEEFYRYYKDNKIELSFAYRPSFMAPYVLDEESKRDIINKLNTLPTSYAEQIIKSLAPAPTEEQRVDLGKFLKEFKRRNNELDLSIYPNNFLKWAGVI
jgi:organic radical activating enzyme